MRAPADTYVTVLAALLARWLKRRRKEDGKHVSAPGTLVKATFIFLIIFLKHQRWDCALKDLHVKGRHGSQSPSVCLYFGVFLEHTVLVSSFFVVHFLSYSAKNVSLICFRFFFSCTIYIFIIHNLFRKKNTRVSAAVKPILGHLLTFSFSNLSLARAAAEEISAHSKTYIYHIVD